MTRRKSSAAVEKEIVRVADFSRQELVELWVKAHGHSPPKGIKRGLLERDHAHRLQGKAFGRLKPATAKALLAIARGQNVQSSSSSLSLKPGTRLVREWNGIPHQVDVTDDGYIWSGKCFASLSAVAKAITGAHWSGPRFFGV
ncbi:MAG: DUF2924 domain-containing protein [Fimbriimonadaceae bacterium]|nr:DUF2924 domain-containing protein [Alphaproteobacteria bacterium]